MGEVFIAAVFAFFIGVSFYFSNQFRLRKKWNSNKLLSFSAGVSITYVLLELFPTFTEAALMTNRFIFLSILFGFIIHHLIEKEIYQHNHRLELIKVLSKEENIFSFFYHVILGIVLVIFTTERLIEGILLLVPIMTFTFVKELPTKPLPFGWRRMLLAGSTLIGVGIGALWQDMPIWVSTSLIGVATGVLLYTIIRHHIPFGRKGKIWYFTIGFFFYAALIILSWFVG